MTTSPLSPDEIRAVAEVHQELGPDYSSAVVESFLEKIDSQIGARIDARIADLRLPADLSQARKGHPTAATLARRRTFLAGAAIGAVGAGAPLTIFALGHLNYGGAGGLAAIWLVIALAFIAGMAGAGALRSPPAHGRAEETEH
jgi:hypothetical protein